MKRMRLQPISVEKINEMFATYPDPEKLPKADIDLWNKLNPLTVDFIIKKHDQSNLPRITLPLKGYYRKNFEYEDKIAKFRRSFSG